MFTVKQNTVADTKTNVCILEGIWKPKGCEIHCTIKIDYTLFEWLRKGNSFWQVKTFWEYFEPVFYIYDILVNYDPHYKHQEICFLQCNFIYLSIIKYNECNMSYRFTSLWIKFWFCKLLQWLISRLFIFCIKRKI